ncbi:MAG: hypothetical protein JRH20_06720 [Deltaproteobacteria bacterium]|nr:hypothetical protein [Deltaproteobacteria bacterium]
MKLLLFYVARIVLGEDGIELLVHEPHFTVKGGGGTQIVLLLHRIPLAPSRTLTPNRAG